jgi:hypothetical protein
LIAHASAGDDGHGQIGASKASVMHVNFRDLSNRLSDC